MRLPLLFSAAVLSLPLPVAAQINVTPLGVFSAGGETAAEIPAYDPATRRVFSVNGALNRVDIIDISNPSAPTLHGTIPTGGHANSVDVHGGVVAVAVQAAVKTDPGKVRFYNTNGGFLSELTVGSLPDMVTFTPNGRYVLVANEGEPNDDYTIDPEGSVSVIRLRNDITKMRQSDVKTARFGRSIPRFNKSSIRIFGPNASFAQDVEPEYIAPSPDSTTAMVTLQENNAVALLHIPTAKFLYIRGLGFKDHNLPNNKLDASDRDGPGNGRLINIRQWPVLGMYQPDAIATVQLGPLTYYLIANEGDARAWEGTPGFVEDARVKDLELDPLAFPNANELKVDAQLGRLTVTTANGDYDGDGDYDALFAFGGRSFSVLDSLGRIVWDSGDEFEQKTAELHPTLFNSEGTAASFDTRSDNKGPEPEGITTGKIGNRTYAFIGLERIGGVMVYDLTLPWAPKFVQYVRSEGDVSPEGLVFIRSQDSPNGKPLLVVSHEVSGTVRIFEINQ